MPAIIFYSFSPGLFLLRRLRLLRLAAAPQQQRELDEGGRVAQRDGLRLLGRPPALAAGRPQPHAQQGAAHGRHPQDGEPDVSGRNESL